MHRCCPRSVAGEPAAFRSRGRGGDRRSVSRDLRCNGSARFRAWRRPGLRCRVESCHPPDTWHKSFERGDRCGAATKGFPKMSLALRRRGWFAPSRSDALCVLLSERAPGAKAPGAVLSFRERCLFDDLSDLLRMNDERGMAAGDFRRLSLHSGCERLLSLGSEDLVLRGDDIERRLVMPGGNVDGGLERNVIQRKLRVGQVLGDFRGKV